MNDKLSTEQAAELESKIEGFESYIESSVEINIESDESSIDSGEYKYLIEDHCYQQDLALPEDLQEALELSDVSLDEFMKKVITEDHFKMEYEKLSSPFQYGGAYEDEFYSLQWGGDRECQIDRESVDGFFPSFNLKDYFESMTEFCEYVKLNIGRSDNLEEYFKFATTDLSHINVIYNTDYDVVRCRLEDEDVLLEFLNSRKKPEEPWVRKTLKLTLEEYQDLRNSHSGFCVKCGKINDGSHEPDAENYECSHCEATESFGVEILFMGGDIEIVDSEDESTLESALD